MTWLVVAVISTMSSIPVNGARMTAAKKVLIPTIANAVGSRASPGARALHTRAKDEPAAAPSELGLTPREREVLELVAQGMTNRQIADALFISVNTAGIHVSRILGKLDVASRTEAAVKAYRLGLVAR
jgi:DNA-binding NarL/FixJ family response regulator